jgi:membrane-anchored glycerophosphoryl diester phosphodiesterase (GDPDase)
MLQEILVLLTFLVALFYLFTKLIWTPPFMQKNAAKSKGCGSSGSDCGCH